MRKLTVMFTVTLVLLIAGAPVMAQTSPIVIAIKAGRLIDPETGTATTGQVIIIEGEKDQSGRNEPHNSCRSNSNRSVETHGPARSRRCAHTHGADLQRAARE